MYGGRGSRVGAARRLSQEPGFATPPPSLEWLTAERLLELIAHDLNNLCHGAMSYLDLALDPTAPLVTRTKFSLQAKDLVRRAALFTPTVRTLVELSTADLGGSSEPLRKALDEAHAKALERHAGATLYIEKSGAAWDARTRGGKWVTQAFLQVLDNSLHFSSDGRSAKVHAEALREGPMLRVTLRDEGKGFTPGQETYVLRRFADPGKLSGGGIGLAIVRVIAERSGGSVEAAQAQNPKGAIIRLRLPESH